MKAYIFDTYSDFDYKTLLRTKVIIAPDEISRWEIMKLEEVTPEIVRECEAVEFYEEKTQHNVGL